MRPKAKYAVIYRHRGEYPISVMCKFFGVSRSGYYCFVKRLGETERDAAVAKEIEECQRRTTYGYRRVWKWLRDRNIQRNPKTVLRIMKKYGLLSEVRRRRQWVNLGQQVHKYENLLNRQFRATRPNEKWVTDISYIHTREAKLNNGSTAYLQNGGEHAGKLIAKDFARHGNSAYKLFKLTGNKSAQLIGDLAADGAMILSKL